jgi:hypothetical protein
MKNQNLIKENFISLAQDSNVKITGTRYSRNELIQIVQLDQNILTSVSCRVLSSIEIKENFEITKNDGEEIFKFSIIRTKITQTGDKPDKITRPNQGAKKIKDSNKKRKIGQDKAKKNISFYKDPKHPDLQGLPDSTYTKRKREPFIIYTSGFENNRKRH